jgi:hypothetical protein
MNEEAARAMFQACSRGHIGLMFGEFCAWCGATPSPTEPFWDSVYLTL